MWITLGSVPIMKQSVPRLWNGRQPGTPAPAARPGSLFKISPDAWAKRSEHRKGTVAELHRPLFDRSRVVEVDRKPLPDQPPRCGRGSTGVAPLRISKCSCGEVTLPVC